jgi:predicted ABC-type ATPase
MSLNKDIKRMRVFAGPNGSGKSTIIRDIQRKLDTGIYVNADDIERDAKQKGFINLADYSVSSTTDAFEHFIGYSSLAKKALNEGYPVQLSISENKVVTNQLGNSYEAALIADYIRQLLISAGATFSFETVMSHPSKLHIFEAAREAGYRNYLYYISTESPEINVQRVASRVVNKGHPVSREKIIDRYPRSMDLLSKMIPLCDRCFIFDNSLESGFKLIAEIENGTKIIIHTEDAIPIWIESYVMKKLGI